MINYLMNHVDDDGSKIILTCIAGGTVSVVHQPAIALFTSLGFAPGITFINPDTEHTLDQGYSYRQGIVAVENYNEKEIGQDTTY